LLSARFVSIKLQKFSQRKRTKEQEKNKKRTRKEQEKRQFVSLSKMEEISQRKK
jgi:hypothetical protein